VLMLDRHGNRINRRNPQDIFTPLYNKQIPPGAGQVVHYALTVPEEKDLVRDNQGVAPITLKVRLRYRKFDFEYMALVHGKDGKPDETKVPALPVVDLCEDTVTLPVEGGVAVAAQASPIKPAWQRHNDYGIGLFLAANEDPRKQGMLQAREVFQTVADWKEPAARPHGLLNLARVAFETSDLNGCADLLNQAKNCDPPAPFWTVAFFSARVNIENGQIEQAIDDLEKLLNPKAQPKERNFDFRRDYVLLNVLAEAYRNLGKVRTGTQRDAYLEKAVATFERTLAIDPEASQLMTWRGCWRIAGRPLNAGWGRRCCWVRPFRSWASRSSRRRRSCRRSTTCGNSCGAWRRTRVRKRAFGRRRLTRWGTFTGSCMTCSNPTIWRKW
jgi:hypothetical protein